MVDKISRDRVQPSEQDDKYRTLFVNAIDGLAIADYETGIILECNQALLDLVERPKSEVVGYHQKVLHPPRECSNGAFTEAFIALRSAFNSQMIPSKIITSSGTEKDVEIKASSFVLQGRMVMQGIFRDISEKKPLETNLQESEARLLAIIDNAPAVIFIKDTDGRYLHVNRYYEELFHVDKAVIHGKSVYDIYPSEMANVMAINDQKVFENGLPVEVEEIVPLEDGFHTFLTVKFPLSNQSGEIYAVGGIATDISERKRAEAEILQRLQQFEKLNRRLERRVEERTQELLLERSNLETALETMTSLEHDLRQQLYFTQTLLDTIPLPVFYKDVEGKYLGCNKAFEEFRGITKDALLRKSVRDNFLPDLANKISLMDIAAINSNSTQTLETTVTSPHGSPKKVIYHKARFLGINGEPIGVIGSIQDVTELKNAEAAIIKHNEMLEQKIKERTHDLENANFKLDTLNRELDLRRQEAETTLNELLYSQREQLKLSTAVVHSPSIIFITDIVGNIEYVNPKFTEITGYLPEEAIGRDPKILNSGEQPKEFYKELWKTILEGKEWRGEFYNKKKNGEYYWEYSSISPIRDSYGDITHFVAIKDDITERKLNEQKLQEAKTTADKANAAKSQFLSTMSHEIRTPMNGVIGMTGLLLDTDLSDEQHRFAEIIHHSGETLLALINDILDFSKIEAGKLDLELLDFDLRTTFEDVAEMLAIRATNANLELICLIDPTVPSYLKGDPGRLRQILTNLAGNAIKFTHKGEIVISVKLESTDDDIILLRFEVKDTGIGIPADRLDAIFAPFTQADGSTTRRYGGTGLGLAICKQLTELMGGEIGIQSEEGVGSIFWFTARFEKASELPKTSEVPLLTDLSGTKILVVDDNATNRMLISTLLNNWNCRYETAADGETGLVLLREAIAQGEPFRIALLDFEMPGMDGQELGRQIKSDPLLEPILLVMITSLARRGDAGMLEKNGFAGYLTKPVRQKLLYECLAVVLGNAVINKRNTGIVTRHTIAEATKQSTRILMAEDNVINQKVVQNMLNKLGYKADVVANGLEAVRALELINYDLVLMDCLMPEMDGFSATAAIRGSGSKVLNHAVPIIAMTANAMQGDREQCIEAGMNDYLAKPMKKNELDEILQKWVKQGVSSQNEPDNMVEKQDIREYLNSHML